MKNAQRKAVIKSVHQLPVRHANELLRLVAAENHGVDAPAASVRRAMETSGVYAARERLIVFGSAAVVAAGERAFRSVMEIRDAVSTGVALAWPDYRPASDPTAQAIWQLRQTIRAEVGNHRLDLEQILNVDVPGIEERLRPVEGDAKPGRSTSWSSQRWLPARRD
jgi:hypothetical protein